MKSIRITTLLITLSFAVYGQKVNKLIKEEDVSRIIHTLAADDMMGRSATVPAQIEKATAFIENEFKAIGLTPLKGLNSFRQEFSKELIQPEMLDVAIDGNHVNHEKVVLVTEQIEVSVDQRIPVKRIDYDSTNTTPEQYFFDNAFALVRDTTTALVLVDPAFQSSFQEFKGYFEKRFVRNRKGMKLFVLGKSAATFSIRARQKVEIIKMTNVVGTLEGKSKPDELVVFSGHYDHIGIQKPIGGDTIANGADDDASGTTAVIELARYFKKIKNNNRTLVFVAFTAEEIGGFGSQHFSQQLPPEKVIAMFNIEMIGKPSKWGQNSAFITGFEKSDFGTILQKNLVGTPFQFQPDPYPQQNLFYRSDNATLARLGVPAHTISTDQIDNDKLYHTVNDETESLDMANITAAIRAIALSSKTIVSGEDTPQRIDKSTVR